jgi:hypothetical protein
MAEPSAYRLDVCGVCVLVPSTTGEVRATQAGCPVHGDGPRGGLQPATNWYGTRRHWSANLVDGVGTSLCHRIGNPVRVWSQAARDVEVRRHDLMCRVIVVDLPECRRCVHEKRKRETT